MVGKQINDLIPFSPCFSMCALTTDFGGNIKNCRSELRKEVGCLCFEPDVSCWQSVEFDKKSCALTFTNPEVSMQQPGAIGFDR